MKTIFRFTLLALIATAFCACDDDKSYVAPLDVTPNNLAGTWQLVQWNGAPLAEGSYVYIEFIRKDQKYVMYQNLDSFGARKLTGRFAIERRGTGRHHLRKLRLQRRRLATPLHRDRLFKDTNDMDSQGRPFGHFGLRTLRRHPRGNHRRENGVIKSSRRKAVKGTPAPGCPFYHYVAERPSRHNRIGNARNL